MRNGLCRLTVEHQRDDGCHEVDLALPRDIHLCQLMPSIVELTHGAIAPEVGVRWRLVRIGGVSLDEFMTLEQNGIDDGAMLLLTTVAPPEPVWSPGDFGRLTAQLTDTDDASALLPVTGALTAATVAAAALGWAEAPTTARLVTALGVAAVTTAAAVVSDRAYPDGPMASALSVVAVMFVAAAGFIAVPGGPATPHVLLSSASALAMTMALLRLTRCATVWLTAIASAAALTASAAGAGSGWHLPPATVGTLLAALSLAALAVAPRLSMLAAGVGPPPPGSDDLPVGDAGVTHAHRVLTGLVVGASTAATLGCATVTFAAVAGHTAKLNTALFVGIMAAVLLLRTRVHVDPARRTALGVGGIVSAVACFVIAAAAMPGQLHWFSLLATAAGAAGLSRLIGLSVGPVLQRVVEVAEYVAAAAVVPLACWVAGVYGVVRAIGLS
ncbi:type VII secretion integral membrane protein EccD [Mycolicibacterium pulveris]|uniref:Type VII secretion integral membrane protein EccD n=1 Tax=Mycolicibacterium pulveris TaxID=36813 RepID=A0A7I7UGT4_MYCPV|nr:type VII secretion integral membrane protein EccD [Mycolicibacterium pulveris]MCV6978900.1 type VII secretion integral membrane protein EccD [Mycolicibacterium pulveris]BBY79899.1 type VII secretion integral membrane protein EccD [Mycolicibacterium pulveris]